jgi:hypothetical protein
MPLSDSLSVVGQALKDYIEAGKGTLGIYDVWYGSEGAGIPHTPAVLVEPGAKIRVRSDTGHMTLNTFSVAVTLFHARLDAPSVVRKECDERAEALEAYLHQNMRLNGLLVDSFVESMEHGVATANRVLMRATQLTWTARSKTRLV